MGGVQASSIRVHLCDRLFDAACALHAAGHGVELERGDCGHGSRVTFILVSVRHAATSEFVRKLRIKLTRCNGEDEFEGVSGEFEVMSGQKHRSIRPFLDFMRAHSSQWQAEFAANAVASRQRMAAA